MKKKKKGEEELVFLIASTTILGVCVINDRNSNFSICNEICDFGVITVRLDG